jgi:hypothetical protein
VWSKPAHKESAVPDTGHVLPKNEERATKKHVLKYIGPFANASIPSKLLEIMTPAF